MKKTIILLCTVLALLVTGCDVEKRDNTTTAFEAFAQYSSVALKIAPEDRNQAFNYHNFVETPEGCYFGWSKPVGSEIGIFVNFCPRGGNTFYPLCSKPNCMHKDKNCNAYAGNCFGYYDGALYAVIDGVGKLDVIKMNPDGTDHQAVASLKLKQMGGYEYDFHHGKLLLRSQNSFAAGFEELSDYLITMDLSDASQTEPLAEYLQTEKLPAAFYWYYKDKLFGLGRHNDPTLTEVDVSTGEVVKRELGNVIGFYATDSTLYYCLAEEDEDNGEKPKTEPGFWEYDLESGTTEYRGLPIERFSLVTYDEDNIYAEANPKDPGADRVLYILSRDYELLDSVTLESDLTLAAATSDRLYFIYASGMNPINCYLEKSRIGSGELTLIPIETVG